MNGVWRGWRLGSGVGGPELRRVHVFEAFNGQDLTWSSGLQTLFGKNHFNDARGIIGCALSHFAVWRHVAETKDEVHAIFEDDALYVLFSAPSAPSVF